MDTLRSSRMSSIVFDFFSMIKQVFVKPQKKKGQALIEEVTKQTNILCQTYIYEHLCEANLWPIELESCIERGIHESSVSKELKRVGTLLEEISPPGTYRNVASRTGINLLTVDGIRPALLLLSDILLPSFCDTTWSRIIAFFSIVASISEDCVIQGHPEYVATILKEFKEISSEKVIIWVIRHGGWISIFKAFTNNTMDDGNKRKICLASATIGFCFTFFITIQYYDIIIHIIMDVLHN